MNPIYIDPVTAAAGEPVILAELPDAVEIVWPGGAVEPVDFVRVDALTTVKQSK